MMNPENGAYSGDTSQKEFEFQLYYKHLRPNAQLYGSYLTSDWPQWLFGQQTSIGRGAPEGRNAPLRSHCHYKCFYMIF